MEAITLARGAKITEASWADFVQRLKHDCRGEGVSRHYTADAIFIVQARRLVFGIDRDYTDRTAVLLEDRHWLSPQEYWDSCDEDKRDALDGQALEESDGECKFLELQEHDQWELLAELPDHSVVGWDDRWEYVSSHFTRDAADAFVARKKHDYRDGIRVYVEAQIYCWEYNAIKEAIMDGCLVFNPQAKGDGNG